MKGEEEEEAAQSSQQAVTTLSFPSLLSSPSPSLLPSCWGGIKRAQRKTSRLPGLPSPLPAASCSSGKYNARTSTSFLQSQERLNYYKDGGAAASHSSIKRRRREIGQSSPVHGRRRGGPRRGSDGALQPADSRPPRT